MRPWRPARDSASSWLTRSTVVKKRPRNPARMQLRAMAMARCVLPVPVPPTRTTLRCWAMKPPAARSRTRASLIGVFLKVKSPTSLASGSLATVSWYLTERACFSEISAFRRSPTKRCRLMLALDRCGERFVVGAPHPIELEAAHHIEDFGSSHELRAPELIVAGAVGRRRMEQTQRGRRLDWLQWPWVALASQNVEDDVGGMDALGERLNASRLNRGQSVGEHRGEDFDHLAVAVVGPGELAPHAIERRRQYPVLERCPIAQSAGLARQNRHVMPGIIDRLAPAVAAPVLGHGETIYDPWHYVPV